MSSISAVVYPSPISQIDPTTGASVQEYRDPQTGAPLYQVPSEAQLVAQAAQAGTAAAPAPAAAAAPTPTTTAAGAAPLYPSPEIEIDGATGQVILQYRDETTGAAQYQVPSPAQIALYQHTQEEAAAPRAAPSAPSVNSQT